MTGPYGQDPALSMLRWLNDDPGVSLVHGNPEAIEADFKMIYKINKKHIADLEAEIERLRTMIDDGNI